MTKNERTPNWPYLTFVTVVAAAGLGFIALMPTLQVYRHWKAAEPITGGWSWSGIALLNVICIATFVALLIKIRSDITVDLGSEELVRHGLFGARRIRWSEVRRIVRIRHGLHVEGESVTIPLAPYAFREPGEFVRSVYECAQRAGAAV